MEGAERDSQLSAPGAGSPEEPDTRICSHSALGPAKLWQNPQAVRFLPLPPQTSPPSWSRATTVFTTSAPRDPCPGRTLPALSELRRGSPRGRCPTACPCGLLPEPRHLLPPLTPIRNTSLCFSDPRYPESRRPAPASSTTGPERVPETRGLPGRGPRTPFRGAPGTTSDLQPEKPAGAWLWLRAPGAGSGKAEGWSALGGESDLDTCVSSGASA